LSLGEVNSFAFFPITLQICSDSPAVTRTKIKYCEKNNPIKNIMTLKKRAKTTQIVKKTILEELFFAYFFREVV